MSRSAVIRSTGTGRNPIAGHSTENHSFWDSNCRSIRLNKIQTVHDYKSLLTENHPLELFSFFLSLLTLLDQAFFIRASQSSRLECRRHHSFSRRMKEGTCKGGTVSHT